MFLGTAKRVFTKWIEDAIITKEGLQTIQARIGKISSLSDIGRLPRNIKSNYGGYTAAQWKNFVFSIFNVCSEGCASRTTPSLLVIRCIKINK